MLQIVNGEGWITAKAQLLTCTTLSCRPAVMKSSSVSTFKMKLARIAFGRSYSDTENAFPVTICFRVELWTHWMGVMTITHK